MVLAVFVGANAFLYVQTLPLFQQPRLGAWLRGLFVLLALSFVVAMRYGGAISNALGSVLAAVGTFWLAVMLYLTLFFVVLLLLRLFNRWLFFSEWLDFAQHPDNHRIAVIVVYALTFVVLLAGHINAMMPRLVHLRLEVAKPMATPLRAVMLSDIHMGHIIGNRQLARMVHKINDLSPDVVLLVGDTFDQQLEPVQRRNMGVHFEHIVAKHGVVAVTGNHDYFGQHDAKIAYLQSHGVKVLCDSVISIDDCYIVGRNDLQSQHVLQHRRRPLSDMLQDLPNIDSMAVVVLDHQPFHLEEAQQAGADVQLSGHTHHGQLWPLNYLTQSIYELSHGYLRKGTTHYYVSSGYGTWGPRVRLGSRPEIVLLEIIPAQLHD